MLKISRLADYATLVMMGLANEAGTKSATEVAELTKINLPTVSKILKLLADANLVTSTRGVNGGYQLTKTIDEIRLSEIITAIDGNVALTECAKTDHINCSQLDMCAVQGNWQLINHVVMTVLDKIKLVDMQKPLNVNDLLRQALQPQVREVAL